MKKIRHHLFYTPPASALTGYRSMEIRANRVFTAMESVRSVSSCHTELALCIASFSYQVCTYLIGHLLCTVAYFNSASSAQRCFILLVISVIIAIHTHNLKKTNHQSLVKSVYCIKIPQGLHSA